MCGIFGVIAQSVINQQELKKLVLHARQRGRDSSGFIYLENDRYQVKIVLHNVCLPKIILP